MILLVLREMRFIPTCVGNTYSPEKRIEGVSVHPHVRGEHSSAQRRADGSSGSSPRAWGTRTRWMRFVTIPRFIPTCVGNT